MAVPTRQQLATTTINRDWYLDVNIGTAVSPNYIGVFGIQEMTRSVTPTEQDSSDFDSGGWDSTQNTGLSWSVAVKLRRGVQEGDPTAYDDGQEALRQAGYTLGVNNRVQVQWYEMSEGGPRVEAYRGYASVTWAPEGGDRAGLSTATATLKGQGEMEEITHPDTATPPAPVIAVAPLVAAAAGGSLHIITGTNLSSVTAITVGGTTVNVLVWEYSNGSIAFIAPAKAAGTHHVIATNPGGASATHAGTGIVYS